MNGSRGGWWKGEQERLSHKKLPFVGSVWGTSTVVQGKELGWEGGRQMGRGNPRESIKFKITNQRKSKIIKGVVVSVQDAPNPPLPSTIRVTGRGGIAQAPGLSGGVRGGQPSIGRGQGWPVKFHCKMVA